MVFARFELAAFAIVAKHIANLLPMCPVRYATSDDVAYGSPSQNLWDTDVPRWTTSWRFGSYMRASESIECEVETYQNCFS